MNNSQQVAAPVHEKPQPAAQEALAVTQAIDQEPQAHRRQPSVALRVIEGVQVSTPVPVRRNGGHPSYGAIRDRAYYLYLARGASHGDDWADWFQAERELRSANRRV